MDPNGLKGIPLFDSLSRRDRERVAQWADETEVAAGRHLVDQGRCAYEFFVIAEGNAEVVKDGERIAELGPGDFFGEVALVRRGARTASVVATGPMRVIVMLFRDFREMSAELPEVARRIQEAVEARGG